MSKNVSFVRQPNISMLALLLWACYHADVSSKQLMCRKTSRFHINRTFLVWIYFRYILVCPKLILRGTLLKNLTQNQPYDGTDTVWVCVLWAVWYNSTAWLNWKTNWLLDCVSGWAVDWCADCSWAITKLQLRVPDWSVFRPCVFFDASLSELWDAACETGYCADWT